jgi:hypothetical protein
MIELEEVGRISVKIGDVEVTLDGYEAYLKLKSLSDEMPPDEFLPAAIDFFKSKGLPDMSQLTADRLIHGLLDWYKGLEKNSETGESRPNSPDSMDSTASDSPAGRS